MTGGRGSKSGKGEDGNAISITGREEHRRDSVLNDQGMPILAHNRGASYGSCAEDAHGDSTRNDNQCRHPARHQIGSDVFDFGNFPLMWPGLFSQRLVKKKPSKVLAWLGFSEALNRSQSTFQRKTSTFRASNTAGRIEPSVSSIRPNRVDRIETGSMESVQQAPPAQGRSVYSLFCLDASQANAGADIVKELDDLTTKLARPCANAAFVPTERAALLEQAPNSEISGTLRRLSISNYLEEISKIGLHATAQVTGSTDLTKRGISPHQIHAVDPPPQSTQNMRDGSPRQLGSKASSVVAEATPTGPDDEPSVEVEQDASLHPQQTFEAPPNLKPLLKIGAQSGHEINNVADSNPRASFLRETPTSTKRDACPLPRVNTDLKPPRASTKAVSQSGSPRANSAAKLKATDKRVGCTADSREKKESDVVGASKRYDSAIAMTIEKQVHKV